MFTPTLQLIPEPDGEYSLLVTTPVPEGRYSAGKPTPVSGKGGGKPSQAAQVWHLPLRKLNTKAKAVRVRNVYHRIHNLELSPGDSVTICLTVGKKMVAESSIMLGSPSASGLLETAIVGPIFHAMGVAVVESVRKLSLNECIDCVVQATPKPGNFTGLAQVLQQLGVVDDTQAQIHRGNAANRVAAKGGSIDPSTINSGQLVTVSQSSLSVFMNQRGQ